MIKLAGKKYIKSPKLHFKRFRFDPNTSGLMNNLN